MHCDLSAAVGSCCPEHKLPSGCWISSDLRGISQHSCDRSTKGRWRQCFLLLQAEAAKAFGSWSCGSLPPKRHKQRQLQDFAELRTLVGSNLEELAPGQHRARREVHTPREITFLQSSVLASSATLRMKRGLGHRLRPARLQRLLTAVESWEPRT